MKYLYATLLVLLSFFVFAPKAEAQVLYYTSPPAGYWERTPWFPGKAFTRAPRWVYHPAGGYTTSATPYVLRPVPLIPADQIQQYQQPSQ